MTTNVNSISKFELHYYFNDESHSMDIEVRNKCEREIIAIAKEIAAILDIEIKLETEALIEGGLKERIILLAKNQFLQGVFATILTGVIVYYLTKDGELARLEKEEKRLNIEKLKQDLKKDSIEKQNIHIDNAIIVINDNQKITKHKSNYFKNISDYIKIDRISTAIINDKNEIDSEIIVERKDFDRYILDSDELPTLTDDNASIEIISPVLKKGKYKWKGIYLKNGVVIEFAMKDKSYKEQIIREGISFKNGTRIDCKLEIYQKLDEFGEVKITGYSVINVMFTHDEVQSFENTSAKKRKSNKEIDYQQLSLFDNDNE